MYVTYGGKILCPQYLEYFQFTLRWLYILCCCHRFLFETEYTTIFVFRVICNNFYGSLTLINRNRKELYQKRTVLKIIQTLVFHGIVCCVAILSSFCFHGIIFQNKQKWLFHTFIAWNNLYRSPLSCWFHFVLLPKTIHRNRKANYSSSVVATGRRHWFNHYCKLRN